MLNVDAVFIRNTGNSRENRRKTGCICDKETIKCNKTDLKQQVIDDIHFSACDFYILFYQNAPAQCVISVLRWAREEREQRAAWTSQPY